MPLLNKIEDVLVQIIKLILLVFALWVLVVWGNHMYEKAWPSKSSDTAESTVNWKDVQPDMQFVVEETSRDLGLQFSDKQLQDRLTDAQLRPAFKKADQLLRDFVAQQPEQHARIEKESQARGLAPLHPLLVGDNLPSAKDIEAILKAQQAEEAAKEKAREARLERLWSDEGSAEDASEAAAVVADEDDECCWTDAVDVAQTLHNNATQAYGDEGYTRFVLGAPAAIEMVLKDATLAPKLHEMTVSRLLDMVLTNYSISFSRAVSEQDSDSSDGLWDSLFNSIELTMWSVILSFLVLVVFVVMMIRMEKHLGRISQHTAHRSEP